MIKSIKIQIEFLLLLLIDLIFRFQKFCLYLKTGKHEIERICEEKTDIYDKTFKIDRWLERSKCPKIREFRLRHLGLNKDVSRKDGYLTRAVEKISAEYCENVESSQISSIRKTSGLTTLKSSLQITTSLLITTIVKSKHIKNKRLQKQEDFYDAIYRIVCYRATIQIAERLADIKYDPEVDSHTNKLMSLWNNLLKADKLHDSGDEGKVFPLHLAEEVYDPKDIVSSRWGHIGFQGEDPGTDFRGMGMLGLIQLEYLSRRPKSLARDLLKRSLNEAHSYPFAIVGINITYNVLKLFKDGSMKHLYYDDGETLFRNKRRNLNLLETFHCIYAELFLRFDCLWHESKPENIFAFRELMEKFVTIVKMDLENRNFSFKFTY